MQCLPNHRLTIICRSTAANWSSTSMDFNFKFLKNIPDFKFLILNKLVSEVNTYKCVFKHWNWNTTVYICRFLIEDFSGGWAPLAVPEKSPLAWTAFMPWNTTKWRKPRSLCESILRRRCQECDCDMRGKMRFHPVWRVSACVARATASNCVLRGQGDKLDVTPTHAQALRRIPC